MEGYIPVATYLNEVDAELAHATLAAAGIESFLKYEDTGHMMPSLQQSEGVQVLVNPKDFEEAKILLSSQAFEAPGQ
jgi:hypothetical protein